jgi:hypothetical protein
LREPANRAFAGQPAFADSESEQGVLQGLYKFRFTTERGGGCGVMFATAGGGLYGGDSGSSFVGGFTEVDGVISAEVTMSRHYHDPKYVPMFDVDNAVMKFSGVHRGEEVHFEAAARPCRVFASRRSSRRSTRPTRRRPVRSGLTASPTGFTRFTFACSTASMPATAAS